MRFRCDRCGLFFAGPSFLFKHKKYRCRADLVARTSDPINGFTALCHSEKFTSLEKQNGEGPEQRNVIIQSAMSVTHQGTQTDEDIMEIVLQQEKKIPYVEAIPCVPSPTYQSPGIKARLSSQVMDSAFGHLASNITYIIENRAPDGQEANVVIGKGIFSPPSSASSTVHFPDSQDANFEGPRLGNVIYHSLNQTNAGVVHHQPKASSRGPESIDSTEIVLPTLNNSTSSSSGQQVPTISQALPQVSTTFTPSFQSGASAVLQQMSSLSNGTGALHLQGATPETSGANVVSSAPQVVQIAKGSQQINATPVFLPAVVNQVPGQQQKQPNTKVSDQVMSNIMNAILPIHQGSKILQRTPQVNVISASAAASVARAVQVQGHGGGSSPRVTTANVTFIAGPPDGLPKQLNTVHVASLPLIAPRKPDHHISVCEAMTPMEQETDSPEVRKTYPCEYCGKIFKYVSKLKEHEPTHTGEKPFQCKDCGKCFTQKGTLKDHLRLHSGEKPFKCEVCGESFTWKIQLRVHKSNHTGDEPYKCELCGKCFAVKQYLTVHQRSHPGYEKPFKCDECDRCFTQKAHLVTHKRTHVNDSLKCQDCGKCFTQTEHLQTHRRLHTGEKPYKCGECSECFAVNSDLILHARKHADERPSRCLDCGKGFSRSAALTIHQRIHSGERPYKCKDCGKSFISNTRLIVHQRFHLGAESQESYKCNGNISTEGGTDEAPHRCQTCSKCFAEIASLKEHQWTHTEQPPVHIKQTPMHVEDTGHSQQTPVSDDKTELQLAQNEQIPIHSMETPIHRKETPMQVEHPPLDKGQTPVSGKRTELQLAQNEQIPIQSKETPMQVEQPPLNKGQTPATGKKTELQLAQNKQTPIQSQQTPVSGKKTELQHAQNEQTPMQIEQTPVHSEETRVSNSKTENQRLRKGRTLLSDNNNERQRTHTEQKPMPTEVTLVHSAQTPAKEEQKSPLAGQTSVCSNQTPVSGDKTEDRRTISEETPVNDEKKESQRTNGEQTPASGDKCGELLSHFTLMYFFLITLLLCI